MTLIATGGRDGTMSEPVESPVKVWDAKTGKLVATLKGHVWSVRCLAWNKNVLVSGSYDCSIRIWNATKWEQTAVLDEHADGVTAIAISSNSRILASASFDYTARLWNLDNGQLIRSPLQHANHVYCVSFSADGKLLATGGREKHVNIWDVAAIVKEAGLDDILSDLKGDKSVLHANATRSPVQRRPPAPQVPQGFFDGVSPDRSNFSTQGRPRSSAQPSRTFLGSLFHRSPSDTNDTSPSSPLNWAQNLLKWRKRSGEEIELQVRNSAVVEVPYAKGKRRNASAREVAFAKQKQKQKQKQNTKPSHSKNSTAGSSMSINPNVAKSSQAADSSSATPAIGDATTTTGTTSTPSRPDVILRQAGLWTRIWLFIGCIPHEYTDDRH
ncbi:WD40-repeat-containing domain protein [Suillus tomentosus]|nr:WD40-repeat-containing domain protein [Suillus tomentosus]